MRSSSAAAVIKLSALKEKRQQLAIFKMRQQGNLDHLKNIFQRLWIYVSAGAIFIISGLKLAFFGFSRWYYRVQKPADDLLLIQMAKTEAENSSKTDASGVYENSP